MNAETSLFHCFLANLSFCWTGSMDGLSPTLIIQLCREFSSLSQNEKPWRLNQGLSLHNQQIESKFQIIDDFDTLFYRKNIVFSNSRFHIYVIWQVIWIVCIN